MATGRAPVAIETHARGPEAASMTVGAAPVATEAAPHGLFSRKDTTFLADGRRAGAVIGREGDGVRG